ncbi:phosphatidylserine lipase ABHD16A-like [Paramacrobiotus metropolitanus]|uniref:phosphatidylserine lipase ABHD16A-like n=1 Tax=Paramacrobiotus metropolitanus TaxID=2943436 RepID=UPI002445D144|nr:phosphatidylserine lipase ABHD16A-like [Paramacrobiotus metropolitanus]XP_055340635.1 phosphatidylserine lipase ABHD16A-like [Paramacrobiotus metropolitanus]XP_055340636.1 phosphatidylserine lipase ABHD16A-like [Paramacrobiotus metropolitanus]
MDNRTAHFFDYQAKFEDLDVAFRAKDRSPSAAQKAAKRQDDPVGSFLDNIAVSVNPLQKIVSRAMYPGSWKRMQRILTEHLNNGRFKLATEFDAKRAKIATADGNLLDTMCADRRSESEQGEILVVCCEGNCGFYEVGNMFTAIAAGFSAVGYNLPGFCRSTGHPEPSQIRYAVDAVMQYAISCLKFPEKNILILGYSIGGYPAAWAASQYPSIRGLILDASFDQALPLVLLHTENKMEDILRKILKEDLNINLVELLSNYHGPVTIIRRSQDQIVGVNRQEGYVNHTNLLLKNFLHSRYPEIVNEQTFQVLDEWLNLYDWTQEVMLNQYAVKCPRCPSMLVEYMRDRRRTPRPFPVSTGRSWDQNTREHLTLHLAERHMRTCAGTHITELPAYFIAVPWNAFLE